jgi:hypothetical protein
VLQQGLPPDPADATHENNDYVFERAVKKHKDEGDSQGRIDLYKRTALFSRPSRAG